MNRNRHWLHKQHCRQAILNVAKVSNVFVLLCVNLTFFAYMTLHYKYNIHTLTGKYIIYLYPLQTWKKALFSSYFEKWYKQILYLPTIYLYMYCLFLMSHKVLTRFKIKHLLEQVYFHLC